MKMISKFKNIIEESSFSSCIQDHIEENNQMKEK